MQEIVSFRRKCRAEGGGNMKIVPNRGTLIFDERDNYYHATMVDEEKKEIVLRNAFIDFSFSSIISDSYLKDHKREYVGKQAMDSLYGKINRIKASQDLKDGDPEKVPLKLVSLNDVEILYSVKFDNYHNPNPSIN
jgi:hypothetical protein